MRPALFHSPSGLEMALGRIHVFLFTGLPALTESNAPCRESYRHTRNASRVVDESGTSPVIPSSTGVIPVPSPALVVQRVPSALAPTQPVVPAQASPPAR